MKPRTKLQLEVIGNSQYLYKRENELLPWASGCCLNHIGYATKSRVLCMDCGEAFSPELVKCKRAVCPHCETKLKVEQTKKRTHEQRTYFAIAEIYGRFQVIRNFELRSYHRSNEKVRYCCDEILQHWILDNGKREVVARNHTLNWYYDSWNGDMEIRKSYGSGYYYNSGEKFDVYPCKYHPDSEFKQQYKRYGINHKLEGLTFVEAIKYVPDNPRAETLLKTKQYSLLGRCISERSRIERCWASIKICIRNKYIVKDAGLWMDYLDLLRYFGKDLHNAKYVCPQNLKKEHDRFVAKKKKVDERRELERNYLNLLKYFGVEVDKKNYVFPKNLRMKYKELADDKKREEVERKRKENLEIEARYREFIQRFIDLKFGDERLVIQPLTNVEEFKKEGDELHHCVFTNEYFKKENRLILSAQKDGVRLETIEFDLKAMKVLQCRGKHNNNTEYHERILRLVNKNKKLIRERLTV